MLTVDMVLGLCWGDESKGKITYDLLKNGAYTHCCRVAGGNNAGHTIYHDDKKFVTHLIPAGVFFGVRSVIGPGCVVNVKSFFKELEYLKSNGIDCDNLVKVAYNAHLVTDAHLAEDSSDTKIGTTKRGIGPAYRDKYGRNGLRAESIPEMKPYLTDFMDELFSPDGKEKQFLVEGAQGFYLDPIFGDYPYVTSSHCGVGGAIINGIPHTAIDMVYGACKAYDTYVGAKKFEPEGDEILPLLRKIGSEFGATTGRPRQCNYLNLTSLKRACEVNDVTHLVVSKMDVLQEVNVWKFIRDGILLDAGNEDNFKRFVQEYVNPKSNRDVIFSYTPHGI